MITVSAVMIGLASLIFLKGFVDGSDNQMVENYTDLLIGHIQIHKAGFQQNMSLDKSMANIKTITSILTTTTGVKAFSPRIKDFALISSSEASSGILLIGIDPVTEKKVSTLDKRLREGEFLRRGDEDKIIIGKALAENLKVALGDKIVVMTQGADGSLAAAAYNVAGLLDTGTEEIDKGLALITIKAAQELFVLNKKISEVVIKTDSLDSIDSITEKIKRRVNRKDFEVLNWKEISPMTYQWLQFDQVFTSLILLIVLVIVASGILNTVLMGVLERTREFGIMLALGTKPEQITFMVGAESVLLGFIGVILGSLIGGGAVVFFSTHGIDLSIISSALNNFYIGSIIYPRADIFSISLYCLTVLLTSIFVSVFPAIKASRLSPVEAIRRI